MFSEDEAKALVAGARLAQTWLDPALAREVEQALGKILSVLSGPTRAAAESLALYAPAYALEPATQHRLQTLREAVQARRRLTIRYRDVADQVSQRSIRPLGCFFWGKVWTLAAWCETRQAFRSFRVDRIEEVQRQEAGFRDEAGKTLADFLRQVGASG